MRYLNVALLIVLLAAGCGKKAVAPTAAPSQQPSAAVEPAEVHRIDIGDVEAGVRVEGLLAPESAAPNIAVKNLTGKNEIVAMSTVTVSGMPPPELWFAFTVKSAAAFPDRPAVVQFTVYRDDGTAETAIGSFAAVLGADANLPVASATNTFRVNALEGLGSQPKSLLLHTRGRLLLLPTGTDPATVDAQRATAAPLDTSEALQVNPVRIEFRAEAQP